MSLKQICDPTGVCFCTNGFKYPINHTEKTEFCLCKGKDASFQDKHVVDLLKEQQFVVFVTKVIITLIFLYCWHHNIPLIQYSLPL